MTGSLLARKNHQIIEALKKNGWLGRSIEQAKLLNEVIVFDYSLQYRAWMKK